MASIQFELPSGDTVISFEMDDCDGLDYIVAQARERGLKHYEEPYPTLIAALIKALHGDMFDVGANTGLYSLLVACAQAGVRVHAFEPLPSIADRLEHNLILNSGIANKISLHRLALSDSCGVATFFQTINPYGLLTTSSSLDEAFSTEHGETRKHRVRTTTLDAFVLAQQITRLAFIKIDVEGHERAVLAGSHDAVARLRPVIGIELLGGADYKYLRHFLKSHTYLDCATAPGGITFSGEAKFVAEGWNHLLVPVEQRALIEDLARSAGLAVNGE